MGEQENAFDLESGEFMLDDSSTGKYVRKGNLLEIYYRINTPRPSNIVMPFANATFISRTTSKWFVTELYII